MRVAVVGGLTFQDRDWLWAGLDLIDQSIARIDEIVEGGRPGVDVRASEWASKRQVRCLTVPVRWEKHGQWAALEQNSEMAKLPPDIVLATPCADDDVLAIYYAHKLKVVKLAKMPIAKSPGR